MYRSHDIIKPLSV